MKNDMIQCSNSSMSANISVCMEGSTGVEPRIESNSINFLRLKYDWDNMIYLYMMTKISIRFPTTSYAWLNVLNVILLEMIID